LFVYKALPYYADRQNSAPQLDPTLQGQGETLLATEQEIAESAREITRIEGLLEECKKETKKSKEESAEFERWLEAAWLIGVQQRLANLDVQIKSDLMRLENLQLVSSYNVYFYFLIHIHVTNQEKALEEEQENEGKSIMPTGCLKRK